MSQAYLLSSPGPNPLGLTLLTPSLVIIIIIINRNADDDQFDEIVDRLLRHDKARVSVKT